MAGLGFGLYLKEQNKNMESRPNMTVHSHDMSRFGRAAVIAQRVVAEVDIGEAGLGKATLEGREQARILRVGDELDAAWQPDADRKLNHQLDRVGLGDT